MTNLTYTLRDGTVVTSKDGEWPTQYTNRTQARNAAVKAGNAYVVIQRGRPFYVALASSLNPEFKGTFQKVVDADPVQAEADAYNLQHTLLYTVKDVNGTASIFKKEEPHFQHTLLVATCPSKALAWELVDKLNLNDEAYGS